jgi:hypothetical protein
MAQLEWKNLHDALLTTIELNWATASVNFIITLTEEVGGGATIKCEGLKKLYCPRIEPWGKGEADSINHVDAPVVFTEGFSRLEIKLQSGDVIEIDAKEITLSS